MTETRLKQRLTPTPKVAGVLTNTIIKEERRKVNFREFCIFSSACQSSYSWKLFVLQSVLSDPFLRFSVFYLPPIITIL